MNAYHYCLPLCDCWQCVEIFCRVPLVLLLSSKQLEQNTAQCWYWSNLYWIRFVFCNPNLNIPYITIDYMWQPQVSWFVYTKYPLLVTWSIGYLLTLFSSPRHQYFLHLVSSIFCSNTSISPTCAKFVVACQYSTQFVFFTSYGVFSARIHVYLWPMPVR